LLTVATEVQMIFFRANSRFSISYKMTEFPVVGGGGGLYAKTEKRCISKLFEVQTKLMEVQTGTNSLSNGINKI